MPIQRRATLALTLFVALGGPALAQDKYPNKPVTIIVPIGPGGAWLGKTLRPHRGAAWGVRGELAVFVSTCFVTREARG